MKRLSRLAAAFVPTAILTFALSAPAFALEGAPAEGTGRDIVPPVLWMLCGVAASALALGGLYLLKRRLGGFPENPAWVAPITIMPSSELPQDEDAHGHAAGDKHHAPAH